MLNHDSAEENMKRIFLKKILYTRVRVYKKAKNSN